MTKEELWKVYTTKNPSFARGGNVTMSAAGLKKLFDQTWDIASKNTESQRTNDFIEDILRKAGRY